ncbi:MAG: hypothetical protein M0R51_00010 [Clostridia bacterium]|jgi:hypothetical protein|nr:hypothetical protein [Clostridia bacterium]
MNSHRAKNRFNDIKNHYLNLIETVKSEGVSKDKNPDRIFDVIDSLKKDMVFVLTVLKNYNLVGFIGFDRDDVLDYYVDKIIEETADGKSLISKPFYIEFRAVADEIFVFFAVKYCLDKTYNEMKLKKEIIKKQPFTHESQIVYRLKDEEKLFNKTEKSILDSWKRLNISTQNAIKTGNPLYISQSGEALLHKLDLCVPTEKLKPENFTSFGIDYEVAISAMKKLEDLITDNKNLLNLNC